MVINMLVVPICVPVNHFDKIFPNAIAHFIEKVFTFTFIEHVMHDYFLTTLHL